MSQTAQEIRAALEQERETRKRTCAAKIETILAEHECELEGIPTMVRDGRGGWRQIVQVSIRTKD